MSAKTSIRTVHIKIKDEFTPYLLAITREMRSTSREIHFLEMAYYALANAEAAAEAEELGLIEVAQLAIPIIGVLAEGMSKFAAANLIRQRGAGIIPVGQTAPGQVRTLMSSGPIWGHAGEQIGRISAPMPAGAGEGGGFTVQIDNLTLARDGEDPESVGRTFTYLRAGTLSAEVPAS
jgi:hypothetical protein